MVKFKGDMGTKADKFIHEITDWLTEHITNDSDIDFSLKIVDKGNVYTNSIKGKIIEISK